MASILNGYMLLIDMNLSESHCTKLVEQTAAALDQKILQALFVSTQRNQIELCFKFSIKYEYLYVFGRTTLKINYRKGIMEMLARETTILKQMSLYGVSVQDYIMLVKRICLWFPTTVVRMKITSFLWHPHNNLIHRVELNFFFFANTCN
jgi:hypothetical protein